MSWLEFIASLVSSLAWPATLIALALLLRKEITNLVPLLRRLRYKDVELEFDRSVQELKREALEESLPPPRDLPQAPVDRLAVIADVSPRAAILEAWLYLESALIETAERLKLIDSGQPSRGVPMLAATLQQRKIITPEIRSLVDGLHELRNRAVHAAEVEFPASVVRDYVALALALAEYIRAKGNPST